VEADDAWSLADRLVGEVRADGLGVAGLEPTLGALRDGRVDTLLLASAAEIAPHVQSELIRLATNTGARVEVVERHELLKHIGGVGALLRYRLGDTR
jgi:peptide subunit release factor 1 (eRF1)